MPTPILTIDVDTGAFDRYLKTFDKYQEKLKEQPELWRDIGEEASAFALAGAAMSAVIAQQTEATRQLALEEDKRYRARRKDEKDAKDAEKAEAEREKDKERARRQAIKQVKDYASTVADAVKWTAMGGAAGVIGGALGLFGLDKFAYDVGDQRRSAQGLGVTMGEQQGLNSNLQRYFDVNSVLSNVANAQSNPAQWGALRMMGINPTSGADPAQLTEQAAINARRMFIRDHRRLDLAHAQGLDQIFSPEDLRRLAAPGTSENDIRKSIQDANRNKGLSDEVGKKWQDFTVKISNASLAIQNKLIDKLTTLEKPLEHVIDKFGDMALQFLDRVDFKELGEDIEDFAKYLGSPSFKADFKSFIEDVTAIAQKIDSALKWLGWVPDGSKPGDPSKAAPGSSNWGAPDMAHDKYLQAHGQLPFQKTESFVKSAIGFMGSGAAAVLDAATAGTMLPAHLLMGIIGAESAFGKNKHNSRTGAMGPMQFEPGTWKTWGHGDPHDIHAASAASAKYLAHLMKMFNGDEAKAIAAYNWGEGNVQRDVKRHGADWLQYAPAETRAYVPRVLAGQAIGNRGRLNVQATSHIKVTNQTGQNVAVTANSAAN